MINILRTKFTKIEELLNIIDEEDFQHIFINAIITTNEKDLVLTLIFKKTAINDDQQREYLFSSTLSSLRSEEEHLTTFNISNTAKKYYY